MRLGAWLGRRLFPPVQDDSLKLFVAREDFKYVTLESERAGAITPTERRLIHGIVDFRSVCARDLMQPLTDFPTMIEGAGIEELIAASRGGSLERFLVVSREGKILGIVSLFEAILARAPGAKISLHMRRIASVQTTESALRVLRKLRTARTQVALVMDGDTPKGLLFAEALYRCLVSGDASRPARAADA